MIVDAMYQQLLRKNGQSCRTLSHENEAEMFVDEEKITIVYESGGTTTLPREMVEMAISLLVEQGALSVADVHEGITKRNGARTDRLMAVLRELPDVTVDKRPRMLYYNAQ